MKQDHKIIFFIGDLYMHEYAKKCMRYSISNTVNNITTNIIDKIYTHSIQGFLGYVKQSLLQYPPRNVVQFQTV